MGRLAILLIGALCLAPAAASGEEDAASSDHGSDHGWWGAVEPEEVDHDWWGGPERSLSLGAVEPAPTGAPAAPEADVPAAPTPAPAERPDAGDARPSVGIPASSAAAQPAPEPSYTDLTVRQARVSDLPVYRPEGPGTPEISDEGSAEGILSPEEEREVRRRREGNHCARYLKQMTRYRGDLERARQRDDPTWERATELHLERLEGRFLARCTEPGERDELKEKLRAALAAAARLALKAFTMGAF